MMRAGSLFLLLFFLFGCSPILREPNLQIDEVAASPKSEKLKVVSIPAEPVSVAAANRTPFLRQVKIGTNNNEVRRVLERDVFKGSKPPYNRKLRYTIGSGDVLLLRRTGFSENEFGVSSKLLKQEPLIVDESGSVELVGFGKVPLKGLTLEDAENRVRDTIHHRNISNIDPLTRATTFPAEEPPEYTIGIGDTLVVSRLINSTNSDGDLSQSVETTRHTIGADGVLSILQLGEIEVLESTLAQVRSRIDRAAVRDSLGTDTVVQISGFSSKRVFIIGDVGVSEVVLTDVPLTYDSLLAKLNLNLVGGRDYNVSLTRGSNSFEMKASELLHKASAMRYFVHSDDRISIKEILPESSVSLSFSELTSNSITFIRVNDRVQTGVQNGKSIPIALKGLDLRELLISQGVDVNYDKDLLVRLNREGREYKLSAQSIVLLNAERRVWLKAGDHVTVEDLSYAGNEALLIGELNSPRLIEVNKHLRTTLAQALFVSGAFSAAEADFKHIYAVREAPGGYSAYHFDISNVVNLKLAEDFELRPGDIVFVRTRPLTTYNRALSLALTFLNSVDAGIRNSRNFGR